MSREMRGRRVAIENRTGDEASGDPFEVLCPGRKFCWRPFN